MSYSYWQIYSAGVLLFSLVIYVQACPSDDFVCSDGRCLNKVFLCDGDRDCTDGEDEKDCDIVIVGSKACTSNPCHHHSTCVDVTNGYVCLCPAGFSGVHCEAEMEESDLKAGLDSGDCPDDQFNCPSGLCIDRKWLCDGENDCGDNSDESSCTKTKKMDVKEEQVIERSPCHSNPCLNSATCLSSPRAYVCLCPTEFTGQNCETEVPLIQEECLVNQLRCPSGECIFNTWRCDGIDDCGDDFDEGNCSSIEKTDDPCESNPCHHDGTCVDDTVVYVCRCTSGFTGKHCETDLETDNPQKVPTVVKGECLDDEYKCGSGRCIFKSWVCDGFYDCDDQSDEKKCKHLKNRKKPCQSNPCHHHGKCINKKDKFQCQCTGGHTGDQCEITPEGKLDFGNGTQAGMPLLSREAVQLLAADLGGTLALKKSSGAAGICRWSGRQLYLRVLVWPILASIRIVLLS